MQSSHRRQRVAAAETHPPAAFTIHPVDEYRQLLVFIYSFLFVHLGSVSPHVRAQFQFYFAYEFLSYLCFHLSH